MVQIKLVVQLINSILINVEGLSCYISFYRFNTRLVSNRFRFAIMKHQVQNMLRLQVEVQITTSPCGNFKIHTFTGPGALCTVSNAGNCIRFYSTVDYMVIAGGGGGGIRCKVVAEAAGGYRESPWKCIRIYS